MACLHFFALADDEFLLAVEKQHIDRARKRHYARAVPFRDDHRVKKFTLDMLYGTAELLLHSALLRARAE